MKNWEKYKDKCFYYNFELGVDIKTNELKQCEELGCPLCQFSKYFTSCHVDLMRWLFKEYKEPEIPEGKEETEIQIKKKIKRNEYLICEDRKKELIKRGWITNSGSCMVDILTPRRYIWPKVYFTDYTMEFIEWLELKRQRQVNFDIENIKEQEK